MSGHRTARVLVYTHRWLGIVSGVLFVVWFASGIVMMYARMPELSAAERRARLSEINPAFIRVLPPAGTGDITRLDIGTLEGRPIYRVSSTGRTVLSFADTGDPVPAVDADQALRIARHFVSGVHDVRYDTRLVDADQWSFGVRGRMPLHRIAVEDAAGTRLYVTENGGEVVLKTTTSGRLWGWTGAVLHRFAFAPLRRNETLWSGTIVWLPLAAGVGCIAGRVRGRRFRRYAGLLFGVVATMWIFSGLLSMDPWSWHPGTAPTSDQRARVAGGAIALGDLSVAKLRKALTGFAPERPREVEIIRFRGLYFAVATGGVVSIDEPQFGAREQMAPDLVVGAASAAMDAPIEGISWLDDYDAYYYDRGGKLSLPVLRVRYADPQHTWLYFDPRRGTIARKEERLTRLWDFVVIALGIGGLALSATALSASWRRISRRVTSAPRS